MDERFPSRHALSNTRIRFGVILRSLILIRSPIDLILVCLFACHLHPFSEGLQAALNNSYSMFKNVAEGYAEDGHPFQEIKRQLSYGVVPAKRYPVSDMYHIPGNILTL